MKNRRNTWSWIGIADDLGVQYVGGRIGAAQGPEAFKRQFKRFTGHPDLWPHCVEEKILADEIQRIPAIEARHDYAIQEIRRVHARSDRTVVVGGGHDHGYTHLAALAQPKKTGDLGCINIDAHLDLRSAEPRPTSGSPFRMAIDRGILKPGHLVEFGIQRHCNAPALWEYVKQKKIKTVFLDEIQPGCAALEFKKNLRTLAKKSHQIVVSLDLDGLSEAYAPGVSAPQPQGFHSHEILEMMKIAALEPRVISLGIFELNPLHDRDDQTARLAALCAWTFLSAAD